MLGVQVQRILHGNSLRKIRFHAAFVFGVCQAGMLVEQKGKIIDVGDWLYRSRNELDKLQVNNSGLMASCHSISVSIQGTESSSVLIKSFASAHRKDDGLGANQAQTSFCIYRHGA